jgi:putative colanic acid biosynthesis acetyltransferase WcaF
MSRGKTDLSSYNNSWYKPGSKLKRVMWYCVNVTFILNPYQPIGSLKRFWLRAFGAKLGKGVVVKPRVNIKYPWMLEVGDHVWIGEGVWIDNLAKVKIADNCCLSQGAMLLCGNHNYKKSTFDLIVRGITLQEGAWVGAQAVVCPGVVCYEHSILAVGSIAVSSLEAYFIYQGNPAVKVKERVIA